METITPEELYSTDHEIQNYIQESWVSEETSIDLRAKNCMYCPECKTVTQWRFWHNGYPDCWIDVTDGECLTCYHQEGYC